MYSLELKQVSREDVIKETLNAIETICETYRLENQLGIFTFSMTELLTHILQSIENQDVEFDIGFFIDTRAVVVRIQLEESMQTLQQQLTSTIDVESPFFTIRHLTDKIEFHHDARELSIEFTVNPQPTTLAEERTSNIIEQSVKEHTTP